MAFGYLTIDNPLEGVKHPIRIFQAHPCQCSYLMNNLFFPDDQCCVFHVFKLLHIAVKNTDGKSIRMLIIQSRSHLV